MSAKWYLKTSIAFHIRMHFAEGDDSPPLYSKLKKPPQIRCCPRRSSSVIILSDFPAHTPLSQLDTPILPKRGVEFPQMALGVKTIQEDALVLPFQGDHSVTRHTTVTQPSVRQGPDLGSRTAWNSKQIRLLTVSQATCVCFSRENGEHKWNERVWGNTHLRRVVLGRMEEVNQHF